MSKKTGFAQVVTRALIFIYVCSNLNLSVSFRHHQNGFTQPTLNSGDSTVDIRYKLTGLPVQGHGMGGSPVSMQQARGMGGKREVKGRHVVKGRKREVVSGKVNNGDVSNAIAHFRNLAKSRSYPYLLRCTAWSFR